MSATTQQIDHGARICYSVAGERAHMLHEVSVPFDGPRPAGFTYSYGWRDHELRHWQCCTMRVALPAGHERYWVRHEPHADPDGAWEVVDELALGNPRAVEYANCQFRAQRKMDALVWALREQS